MASPGPPRCAAAEYAGSSRVCFRVAAWLYRPGNDPEGVRLCDEHADEIRGPARRALYHKPPARMTGQAPSSRAEAER